MDILIPFIPGPKAKKRWTKREDTLLVHCKRQDITALSRDMKRIPVAVRSRQLWIISVLTYKGSYSDKFKKGIPCTPLPPLEEALLDPKQSGTERLSYEVIFKGGNTGEWRCWKSVHGLTVFELESNLVSLAAPMHYMSS